MFPGVSRYAGSKNLTVDPLVCEVVEAAKLMGDRSDGVFDITILPLLKAYGFRNNRSNLTRIPEPEQVAELLSKINYRQIFVDNEKQLIGLESSGAQIDLGGIAKGYAVDRAVYILRSHGIQKAIINAGGDIFAIGAPNGEEGWHIGIQHPQYPEKLAATVHIRDKAIATSGNYENFIRVNGRRYGQLFDPRTGNPSNPMLSATIVASTSMEADALSTTAFLKGQQSGYLFVQYQKNAESIFITKQSDLKIDIKSTDNFPRFEVV